MIWRGKALHRVVADLDPRIFYIGLDIPFCPHISEISSYRTSLWLLGTFIFKIMSFYRFIIKLKTLSQT